MPIAIKKLGQRGGPAGQDKTINIMPNQAKKRKNPAVKRKSKPGEVPTRSSYGAGLAPKRRKAPIKKMKRGGAMKKKGYAMGGMKKKGYAAGGMTVRYKVGGMAKGKMYGSVDNRKKK